jgi:hypothetical protein
VIKLLKNTRLRQRLITCIALFAILVHLAAPLAAHATMQHRSTTTIVLCTTHGLMQIQVAADSVSADPLDVFGSSAKLKTTQPCALCALAQSVSPPMPFSVLSLDARSLVNALFTGLGGTSTIASMVVQRHAPPTGPPTAFFV